MKTFMITEEHLWQTLIQLEMPYADTFLRNSNYAFDDESYTTDIAFIEAVDKDIKNFVAAFPDSINNPEVRIEIRENFLNWLKEKE